MHPAEPGGARPTERRRQVGDAIVVIVRSHITKPRIERGNIR